MNEYPETKIVPRRNWPVGSRPDEMVYSVEATQNMRAVMATNDLGGSLVDTPAADEEGAIIWELVDPERTKLPDIDYHRTGTYVEISDFCHAMNARQDKWGTRPFTFYPAIVTPLAA